MAILISGAVNLVLQAALENTQIGAFYEEEYYSETYTATLLIDETPIFCIVEMSRTGKTDYFISKIYLPYGKTQYLEAEYDTTDSRNEIALGYWGDLYSIVLDYPVTELSFARLSHETVSNYGAFFSSKNSDMFHFDGCTIEGPIPQEDFIYFRTDKEAYAFGYEMCNDCRDRY